MEPSRFEEMVTDAAILEELGRRVKSARLRQEMTQEALAEQAGISKRTLERIEAGQSTQTSNLIRVLIALDRVTGLEDLLPSEDASPLAILKKEEGRERARRASSTSEEDEIWSWGQE